MQRELIRFTLSLYMSIYGEQRKRIVIMEEIKSNISTPFKIFERSETDSTKKICEKQRQ